MEERGFHFDREEGGDWDVGVSLIIERVGCISLVAMERDTREPAAR